MVLDVDCSAKTYDAMDVSYRIPHGCGMIALELYHNGELIFSEDLPLGCMISLPLIFKCP
jgi:hypothetical protein